MGQPSKEPCKKEACDIQACLSKNLFDSKSSSSNCGSEQQCAITFSSPCTSKGGCGHDQIDGRIHYQILLASMLAVFPGV